MPRSKSQTRRAEEKVLRIVKELTGRVGDDNERHPPMPPDLEGVLDKLKHKTTFLGSWNRRYFVIDPSIERLLYFNTKQDYQLKMVPSGYIDLPDIKAVRQFTDTSFQIEAPERTFLLRAESKAEFTCWVTALQEYVAKYHGYERWKTIYDNAKKSMNEEP